MTKETVISLMLSVFPLESGMFLRILGIYSTFTSQIMRYIKICKKFESCEIRIVNLYNMCITLVMMGAN